MSRQPTKDIKTSFQLPGKLALALENLVGKIQEFFRQLANSNPESFGIDFTFSK